MANHGYCKNCWWWEPVKFDLKQAKNVLGVCWCWKGVTDDDAYCPDYWNREKGNKKDGSLESWVKSLPATYEYPRGTKFKRQ